MKNFKLILIAALALMVSMPAFAQKSGKALKKEVMATVNELDEKQQLMLLNYARGMQKVNAKKELAKTIKKLSATDRQKILDYATKIKSVKAPKAAPAPRVKTTPGVAKKPKAKTKATTPTGPTTQVEVIEATHDFGIINQGEKAQHVYKIKNVGKNPLIISKAKGSCGCTVPKWPKEPIAPGEIAEIDVVFNSRGKKGKQSKRITITANTDPGQTFLTIKGEVKVANKVIKDVPKPKPAPKNQ